MDSIYIFINNYGRDPLFWVLYGVFAVIGAIIAYIYLTKKKIPRHSKHPKVFRTIIAILFGLTFIGSIFVLALFIFSEVLKMDKKKSYSASSAIVLVVLAALGITTANTETVYYKNCTEVWEAGHDNITKDDEEYLASLDRDNDGIACERGSNASNSDSDDADQDTDTDSSEE